MEYYNVGQIVNTQGIKGDIKVLSLTDFPDDRFKKGQELYLFKTKDDVKPIDSVTVTTARVQKGTFILHLQGFDNINDVESFKGMFLKVSSEQLDALDDGEYYYHEIVGLKVIDVENQEIGTVSEILPYGPNDVWVIKRDGQKDLLIPYIKQVVLNVDVENHVATVDLPEGLE